jgi:hypothetical protein
MDITISNYESFFLLYADNELDAAERTSVENFIAGHPAQQAELALLLSARFPADDRIVFQDHSILLHKEKERRVIPIFWFRAAAVVLLLLSGMSYLLWFRTGTQVKQPDAVASGKQMPASPAILPATPVPQAKIAMASRPVVQTSIAVHAKYKASVTEPAIPVSTGKTPAEPVEETTMAVARQLPSLDRRTSSAPETENVLEADDDDAAAAVKNNAQTTPAKTTFSNHTDLDEPENAVNVFAVNKNNKTLSTLLSRASRVTRSADNNALASAGVRVSLFQINLK